MMCKWNYLGHANAQQTNDKVSQGMEACKWDEFWAEIGLGDLIDGHHAKTGVLPVIFCLVFPFVLYYLHIQT